MVSHALWDRALTFSALDHLCKGVAKGYVAMVISISYSNLVMPKCVSSVHKLQVVGNGAEREDRMCG